MVAEDAALETVVYGTDGILNALPKGAIHVSCSTISVALAGTADRRPRQGRPALRLGAGVRPAAGRGTGQLFVVAAAGEAGAIADAEPIFAAIGSALSRSPDKPSAANLVKLSGNFLLACVIETLGEAMALTAKDGIDPHPVSGIAHLHAASAHRAYKLYGTMIADRAFERPASPRPSDRRTSAWCWRRRRHCRCRCLVASLLRDRLLTLRAIYGGQYRLAAVGVLAARDAGMEKLIIRRAPSRLL